MISKAIQARTTIFQFPPFSIIGPQSSSLMDALLPSLNTLQRAGISILFVGLLVAFGRATFYLPDNPVPISFQTTGVLLMGGVLGLRWGTFAILAYYILGMIGIPVFKDGGNGWAYVSSGATAGYLIGFVLAAPLIGFLTQHGWDRGRVLWPMLLGNLAIYIPALIWLHFMDLGWPAEGKLFADGMYVFRPGDLVKLMLASMIVGLGWSMVDHKNKRS